MAVRHGYGKIAGADALVFAYDTGDTRNSYKGEPTENLITNPVPTSTTGFNRSGGTGTVTYDATEKAIKWEQTAYSSWGTYFNFHPAFNGTLDTGSQYTFSLEYKSQNEFADSNVFHQVVQGNGQSPATTNTNITSDTYGEVNGWKQYRVTFTPGNSGVSSAYNRFITGNRGTDVLRMWFRNIQFEKKSHKTSFTAGTRSATQGLVDLTGNSTIDLTDVSFDSDAQMTFDGTSDYGTIPHNTTMRDTETLTIESVFQVYSQFGYYGGIIGKGTSDANEEYFLGIYPSGNRIYFDVGQGSGPYINATQTINSNQYYHVVAMHQRNGGTSVCSIYVNGEFVSNSTSGAANSVNTNTTDITVGARWSDGSYSLNGDIPLLKMYNRILTAAEVKNNYNLYKTRFNI